MCVCGCLVAKACKFTRPVGGNCALPYLKGWRKFCQNTCGGILLPAGRCCYQRTCGGFCYQSTCGGGDFVTEEPVRGGDAVYQSTCGGNLSVETLLPKYLWGDFVTKEPVVGFCYQSTCGGILLPKYLWWDFVTKVPVGGFVTKMPVGGSGNLELLLRQTVSWVDLWGRCMGQCCPAALAERNRLTSLVGRNRLSAMGHKNLNRKKRSWLFRFSGRNPLTRATA